MANMIEKFTAQLNELDVKHIEATEAYNKRRKEIIDNLNLAHDVREHEIEDALTEVFNRMRIKTDSDFKHVLWFVEFYSNHLDEEE